MAGCCASLFWLSRWLSLYAVPVIWGIFILSIPFGKRKSKANGKRRRSDKVSSAWEVPGIRFYGKRENRLCRLSFVILYEKSFPKSGTDIFWNPETGFLSEKFCETGKIGKITGKNNRNIAVCLTKWQKFLCGIFFENRKKCKTRLINRKVKNKI